MTYAKEVRDMAVAIAMYMAKTCLMWHFAKSWYI